MQHNDRIAVRLLALVALSSGVAACSSGSSTGSLLPQPELDPQAARLDDLFGRQG